jgi:hypothetical protein
MPETDPPTLTLSGCRLERFVAGWVVRVDWMMG